MRWLVPFVLIGAFFLLIRRQAPTWPYYYDEADYMSAVSMGWRANYTDSPSQSLTDYLRIGLSRGKDPAERAELSRQIRRQGGVSFYRHWHGPLYFYWLLALKPLGFAEQATRYWSYAFPVLTFVLIYAGSLRLLPGPEGFLAGAMAGAFYLWSPATIRTNEIAPHQLFVLCYIAALLLLMKWRSTGAIRYWNGAVVASSAAFCTLEVAFVLLAVLLVCAAIARKLTDRRFIARSAILFAVSVLLLWPGALLRLSFLKAYLFMAYLALYRESPWGHVGLLETWRLRVTESPVEWILIAAALLAYFRFLDRDRRRLLLPVLLYAGLMFLILLRVTTDTPRYLLPFLPAFHLFAGYTFASILRNSKPVIETVGAAALCLAMLGNTVVETRTHPIREAPDLRQALARLRDEHLESKKLLVPQQDLPMIHCYFPGADLSGYRDQAEKSVWLRSERFDRVF